MKRKNGNNLYRLLRKSVPRPIGTFGRPHKVEDDQWSTVSDTHNPRDSQPTLRYGLTPVAVKNTDLILLSPDVQSPETLFQKSDGPFFRVYIYLHKPWREMKQPRSDPVDWAVIWTSSKFEPAGRTESSIWVDPVNWSIKVIAELFDGRRPLKSLRSDRCSELWLVLSMTPSPSVSTKPKEISSKPSQKTGWGVCWVLNFCDSYPLTLWSKMHWKLFIWVFRQHKSVVLIERQSIRWR
jgi:hypothetical protein